LSTKAEQLEWRRSKVTELRARGLSYTEIASELQVSRTSIASDVQYLREQAKGTIKEYATDHLPEQYQVCLTALDAIIKRAFDIVETSDDNREKLHAMELFKDTHLVKLELLSNATTIDSALSYIRNKQSQQKGLALDSTNNQPETDSSSGRQTIF
jgi:transposase